ncbi:unnamed protein product [Urochloa humidicola]
MEAHPRYPLLQMYYDQNHRGRKLEERTEVLRPLRIRTHNPLAWDDRYASYLNRAGFLPLAMLVKDGLPKMDNAALTALIDRWRPETHTFHLPAGEMTVTLQDVSMLFGLRIDGRAVTGSGFFIFIFISIFIFILHINTTTGTQINKYISTPNL